MIELTASDGASFSAYRAEPADTPKGAVVVLQDVFGVTPEICKVADAFAAKGYVAIAPSLFDRVKPGVSLGHDEGGKAEGAAISAQIGNEQAISDIQTTVDAVKSAGKVAVVGYCWGGDLAYTAANKVSGIACVIGYDGHGTVADYREKRKVPTLLHFGESDPELPPEAITQFRAWRPDVSAFTYPEATQGFGCDERGNYREDAAATALERTLFWISQYVEGQKPIQLKNAGAYAQAKTEKKKKKKADDDLGPPLD
ncbi:dienelactone hydrolase family protein [Bradyrhizobium iriomotense]|uniref:dienelactone hydrolase family protein n=1 Tax=Bradyrhizobium iriomotense TaxID=441950 RepID=UPI001B8A08BA|nr:dienelactone hydrolase family protein [Bradyrhizobium iriomotense]MBR1131808.1 dienelactone hydrolase family protein [Bradyrhizobium iriomotense]